MSTGIYTLSYIFSISISVYLSHMFSSAIPTTRRLIDIRHLNLYGLRFASSAFDFQQHTDTQFLNEQPQFLNEQPQLMNEQPQFLNEQPQFLNEHTHTQSLDGHSQFHSPFEKEQSV